MDYETFLSRLDGVQRRGDRAMALCPAHPDTDPSLSVRRTEDGKILVHCFGAKCTPASIVAALGMVMGDLYPDRDPPERWHHKTAGTPQRDGGGLWQAVAEYPYTDERDTLLYEVVRQKRGREKRFLQRRPDGRGGKVWNMDGVRRVPYRWPEVRSAITERRRIYIVEGEKDVDNARARGLTATTNAGGAGKWPADWSPMFAGAHLVIVSDNDDTGRRHARQVAGYLSPVAASVRVLDLSDHWAGMPEKADLSDWLAQGGTGEELERLADASAVWKPPESEARVVPRVAVLTLADIEAETVEWLWQHRIPFGKLVLLDGDPGLGKTTVALEIAARMTRGDPLPTGEVSPDGDSDRYEPLNVMILSLEDGLADTIRPRMEAAGADLRRVFVPRFADDDGNDRLATLPDDLPDIAEAVRANGVRLVIIDPLMAALSGEVNSYRDQDVRRVLSRISLIAGETGAAFLVLRHLTKGGAGTSALYRGQGSIGFAGAARSVLMLGLDPQDDTRRVLAPVKSNLGKMADSLTFRLESVGDVARVVWEGVSSHKADDLTSRPSGEERSSLTEATDFLLDLLADGPVAVVTIETDAKSAGIAERTLRRAKDSLRVRSRRQGGIAGTGGWVWMLPEG